MKVKSENKQIFIASIINYVTFGFNILVAIFFTPFLLKSLGDVDYGIRSFAISFVTYTTIIGTGVSTAYLRFANIKKNEYGEDGVKDVDGIFLKIFIVLGLASLFIGLLLFTLFITKAIPLAKYSDDQIFVISVVVLLSFITLGIKLPCSVCFLILNFKRKFIFRNTRFLLSALFEYAVSFLCLILGITVFKSSVIALSMVSLVSEIIFGIVTIFYLAVILKHKLNFKAKVVEKTIWKDIITFSVISLMIVAVMSLNDSTDRIILGFFSPEAVTFYSLAIIFNAYIRTAADSISVLFTPRLAEQATGGKINDLQKTYDFVSKICVVLISLIVFGYVCCGKEFLIMWLGQSKKDVYYYSLPLMVGLIALYPQHFSINIHRAYGKQKFAATSLSITFLINVAVSISLALLFNKLFGNPVIGCIVGTLFTYLCESIVLSIYNHKKLGLKQDNVWFQIIINTMICFCVAIIILRSFDLIDLNIRPVYIMIIKGIIYLAVVLVIQILINKRDFVKLLHWRKNEEV